MSSLTVASSDSESNGGQKDGVPLSEQYARSCSESQTPHPPHGCASPSCQQCASSKVYISGTRTPHTPGGNINMTPSLSWQGHTPLSHSSAASGDDRYHGWMAALNAQRDASSSDFTPPGSHHYREPSVLASNGIRSRKVFESHLLDRSHVIEKPWKTQRSRRLADRRACWSFLFSIMLGVLGTAALLVTAYLGTPKNKFCLVLAEDFSGTEINTNIWFHEQQTGGFGTGEFEWVTNSPNNSYVQDGYLYIVPTLTSDYTGTEAITNAFTLNLTADGSCTSSNKSDTYCAVASNLTKGDILPPVQSARLMTNFSVGIKYGRVEVRAKMPTGDWIWPAIWMMPKDSVYGVWPRSGEIDIVESKGNKVTSRSSDGPNMMHSTLHWGLDADSDRWYKTTNTRQLYRGYYDEDFHTFGLDWTPEGIRMWEGSPTHTSLSYDFGRGFWHEGNFPTVSSNGTTYSDPWPIDDAAAPFDQEFYLILSVAVGGTNGFFGEDDMPWSNSATNAVNEFWEAKDTWYPTWPTSNEDRALVVDYVKMWNLEGVEGFECPSAPVT